jgi:hypothetical protein
MNLEKARVLTDSYSREMEDVSHRHAGQRANTYTHVCCAVTHLLHQSKQTLIRDRET